MAESDLPGMFEYIAEITNCIDNNQINYIRHSEGTTEMFAALSERKPVIVNNIIKYVAFGPCTYTQNGNKKY